MKCRNILKLILCLIISITTLFSLTACNKNNSEKADSQTTTTVETTQHVTDTTTQTIQPQSTTQSTTQSQHMCYWCGELPVGDFETYCSNCSCLLCGNLRKNGGVGYIYCDKHNCNENGCELPAADDSSYCVQHKCNNPSCGNEKWPDSEYCPAHKQ